MTAKYRFIMDPSHGYLEVPRSDVEAARFQPSTHSYFDPKNNMVYLEQYFDDPGYLTAAGLTNPDAPHKGCTLGKVSLEASFQHTCAVKGLKAFN